MSAQEQDVEVKFGAAIGDLLEGVGKAREAVQEFAHEGMEHLEGLNKSIGKIQQVFSAFAELATLGFIGEQFAELGAKTAEYAEQLELMGQAVGVESGDLAGLGYAATTVGVSMEGLRTGLAQLSRAMVDASTMGGQTAAAFRAVGLPLADLQHMSTDEVLKKIADRFAETQDSASKTAIAMALFGRSGAQLVPLLDKGSAGIGELKDKAKELGLVLDSETNARSLELAEKLKEVHAAGQGLALTISAQMQPALMAVSNAFIGAATDGQTFKGIGEAVGVVMRGVALAVGWVTFALKDTGDELGALAAAAAALMHGDIAGAQAVAAAREDEAKRNEAAFDKMKAALLDYHATEQKVEGEGSGGKTKGKLAFGGDAGSTEKLAAELALQKAGQDAERNLLLEHLKEAQSIYDTAHSNNELSDRDYYAAKLAIELRAFDASLDALNKQLAAEQEAEAKARAQAGKANTPQDRSKAEAQVLQFQTEQTKTLGQIAVLQAQRADAARRSTDETVAAERKLNDQLATIAADRGRQKVDAEIAMERSGIEQAKALRQIDNQTALQQQLELEQREYDALVASLDAKAKLLHGDVVKQAQLDSEREAAYLQHQQRMTDIAHQAELDRQRLSIQAQQQVQAGFQTMVSDLMGGHKRLRDAVLEMGQTITKTFQQLIAQKFAERLFGAGSAGGQIIDSITKPVFAALDAVLAKFVVTEKLKTAATEEGVLARVAAETWGAVKTVALTAWTAIKTIGAKAAEAFASVYASIAQIPYVGPFLAPVMAGTALYEVGSMVGHLASAEGGWWQVPGDQIAQVHKNEMVLPAEHAANLRALLASGQQANAGGNTTHVHISPTINAIDARGVKDFFKNYPAELADGIKNAVRLGHGRGTA